MKKVSYPKFGFKRPRRAPSRPLRVAPRAITLLIPQSCFDALMERAEGDASLIPHIVLEAAERDLGLEPGSLAAPGAKRVKK